MSPRARARKTLELLRLGCQEAYPWQETRDESEPKRTDAKVTVTEDVREWDYGEYEGITSKEIREKREAAGLGTWDIWRDGCPGGEYGRMTSLLSWERFLNLGKQVARTDYRAPRSIDP